MDEPGLIRWELAASEHDSKICGLIITLLREDDRPIKMAGIRQATTRQMTRD